jgi:hypothetical protein
MGDYRWMSYDDANALSEEVGREENKTENYELCFYPINNDI